MKRPMKAAIAPLVALAACQSAPARQAPITNSRTYEAPFDEVWSKAVAVLASRSIQIKTIEKDSGVIYAEPGKIGGSYIDCGQSGLAGIVGRTATLNLFIKPEGAGSTLATVNLTARETRQFDTSTWNVDCFSTGLLEAELLELLVPGP